MTNKSPQQIVNGLGRFNRLQIIRQADFGLFLEGAHYGDILLPSRYVPKNRPAEIGDWLDIFLYLDSDDRVIATTQTPRAQVGQCANLQVIAINNVGIFFDWGLPKDLLMPYSEELDKLEVGDYCVVYLYLDPRHGRITATAKVDRYLDRTRAPYIVGDAVEFLVARETNLGMNGIIDHQFWGLIHKNELFKPLKIGSKAQGFIKEMRNDGKISLSLQPVNLKEARASIEEEIMKQLEAEEGVLFLSDKSAPEEITKIFNVSKSNFKKALGGLYKQGLIEIQKDRIIKKPLQ